MIEVFCEFPLEIAHSLPRMPEGHKCRRVHGHSYRVRVTISQKVESPPCPEIRESGIGMILDYAALEAIWMERIHAQLDHQNINDVLETEISTSEEVVSWIAMTLVQHLPDFVSLESVELWETARFGARWTRPVWSRY